MTDQMKSDIKYLILITFVIIICGLLTGCASLRDYSEWKMKKEQGCAVCCPTEFGSVFKGK